MPNIKTGSTKPEDWKDYTDLEGDERGITVEVDTSAAEFKSTPHYITSLLGNGHHWTVTGVNALYNASRQGFSIYLRWSDRAPVTDPELPNPLTSEFAEQMQWVIQWTGVESESDSDA